MRTQHTLQQKQQASELLLYEVIMLHDLSCRMESELKEDTIIGTALLEAFSIHTRVLHDFFYSENPAADEVIAEDFFESPSDWHSMRTRKSDLLDLAIVRIGEHAGRLTYLRREVIPILKGWDHCQIARELRSTFSLFIQGVPAGLLSPRCAELKHKDLENENNNH